MKNQVMAIMLILGLGSLTWGSAQSTKNDLFDLKKSRQELEVMKGILSTTIGFVSPDSNSVFRATQASRLGTPAG